MRNGFPKAMVKIYLAAHVFPFVFFCSVCQRASLSNAIQYLCTIHVSRGSGHEKGIYRKTHAIQSLAFPAASNPQWLLCPRVDWCFAIEIPPKSARYSDSALAPALGALIAENFPWSTSLCCQGSRLRKSESQVFLDLNIPGLALIKTRKGNTD